MTIAIVFVMFEVNLKISIETTTYLVKVYIPETIKLFDVNYPLY